MDLNQALALSALTDSRTQRVTNSQLQRALGALTGRRTERVTNAQLQRALGLTPRQRLRGAVRKVISMQAAVGQLQQVAAMDDNAVSAAIVKFTKPVILNALRQMPHQLAGEQGESDKEQLVLALDKLEEHYTSKTSPGATQQATSIILRAVGVLGDLVAVVMACAVIILLPFVVGLWGIPVSIVLANSMCTWMLVTMMNIEVTIARMLVGAMFGILKMPYYATTSLVSLVSMVFNYIKSYL